MVAERAEHYGGQLEPFVQASPSRTTRSGAARDYLAVIREHARATRTSPDALLAVILARTACEIGPCHDTGACRRVGSAQPVCGARRRTRREIVGDSRRGRVAHVAT